MTLTQRLRAATDDLHQKIERLPFSAAMISGRLSRAQYAAALSQLLHGHRALEAALTAHAPLGGLFTPDAARVPALVRDLRAFGGDEAAAMLPAAAAMADRFYAWGRDEPKALAGALYIFEGSRMGSMILVRALARTFSLPLEPGVGLDYHLDGMADRPAAWGRFKATLDHMPMTADEAEAVVEAGATTMEGLFHLYSALDAPAIPAEAEAFRPHRRPAMAV